MDLGGQLSASRTNVLNKPAGAHNVGDSSSMT